MSLDAVLAALPRDPSGALRDLLLVWEQRRAPEIAELIAALDARVGAGRVAPPPPQFFEDAAWTAIARKQDLADVGRLLAPPFHPNPHWNIVRLTTMVKYHGLDARISGALLAIVVDDHGREHGLWHSAAPLLKRFADPRAPAMLRELIGRKRAQRPHLSIAESMREVADRIERAAAKREPLSPAERTLVARLATAIEHAPPGGAPTTAKGRKPVGQGSRTSVVAGTKLDAILGRAKTTPPEAVIAALVESWRAQRHPLVAELITRLGARLDRPALPHEPALAAFAAWRACRANADAADADRLVAALRVGTVKQIVERLRELAAEPAHPRFADAAIAIFADQPFTSASTRSLYGAAADLLAAMEDPRSAARLEDIQTHRMPGLGLEGGTDFRDFFAAKIKRALSTARKVPAAAELTASELAAVEASLRALVASNPRTEESLLAAIWAAPADDGPRTVYADWLQERGRPHGELIALQLARHHGTASPAGRARERELIAEHWKVFVGPLAPAVQRSGLVFERGFVVHAEIPLKRSPRIVQLSAHPAWATLKSFSAASGARKQYPALIEHLGMLGARELTRGAASKHYG